MGRRIVLLSDGTGNSSAKVWRTNVWRIFERLDLSQSDQVAFYDDGVGTAAFKPLALLGGAFGFGLKRNVIDLYKFACRNYRGDDDEIYGFGFSRGAFTIRVVIGLIANQGLVRAQSEPELHAKAVQAYRAYRAAIFHTKWPRFLQPERWARAVRNMLTRSDYHRRDNRRRVNIRFLGLWDTVAAYGMPVEEMTVGVSHWLWPLMLPKNRLSIRVKRACHALSIDDERTTFHPVLWDERREAPLQPDHNERRYLHNERVSQVWFPGVHANVGGGYPEDALAQIPLTWILREAQRCDLRFKTEVLASPQTYDYPRTAQDRDGRIYDPRQGLGGYYRYGPRDVIALGDTLLARRGQAAVPRVHESVLRRIANRAHAYAPIGLPARYEVVRENDSGYEVVDLDQSGFETSDGAAARCHEQQRAWNIVWWRRGLYFLTVGVTLHLLAFPVVRTAPVQDEFGTPLRPVSEALRLVEGLLPAAASPWFDFYARRPEQLLLVAFILIVLLRLSTRLAAGAQTRMDLAWQRSLRGDFADIGPPTDLLYRVRTSRTYVTLHRWLKWRLAPAFFAVLFVYLGIVFLNRVAFKAQDYVGLICRETPPPEPGARDQRRQLQPGEIVTRDSTAKIEFTDAQRRDPFPYSSAPRYVLMTFSTVEPCQATRVLLARDRRYLIKFESTDTFTDWAGLRAPFGYSSTRIINHSPRTWSRRTTYWRDQIVTHSGIQFMSLADRNIGQQPPADWNKDATYAIGNEVVGANRQIYTSAQNGNSGNNPVTDDGTRWTRTGIPPPWTRSRLPDPTYSQRAINLALLPFRREMLHPWFQVVARVGGIGGDNYPLDPDFTEPRFKYSTVLKPRRDGELFLFMNSPVLGVWRLHDVFYRLNQGSTRVLITQCDGDKDEGAFC